AGGQHGDDDFRPLGRGIGALRRGDAALGGPFEVGRHEVISDHGVPCLHEVASHRRAHVAEADECDLGHVLLPDFTSTSVMISARSIAAAVWRGRPPALRGSPRSYRPSRPDRYRPPWGPAGASEGEFPWSPSASAERSPRSGARAPRPGSSGPHGSRRLRTRDPPSAPPPHPPGGR